jgi:hypothetical protein
MYDDEDIMAILAMDRKCRFRQNGEEKQTVDNNK